MKMKKPAKKAADYDKAKRFIPRLLVCPGMMLTIS
jgi:hypothetical protein